jgi:16S rRNA (adenine1518-N6/adenine1519-N6)-dimethyltransferase
VDSAVVRLVPRLAGEIGIDDRRRFSSIVRAAFGQRRKTLRNALDGVVDSATMVSAGIRPDARAEQLAVTDFIRLSNRADT